MQSITWTLSTDTTYGITPLTGKLSTAIEASADAAEERHTKSASAAAVDLAVRASGDTDTAGRTATGGELETVVRTGAHHSSGGAEGGEKVGAGGDDQGTEGETEALGALIDQHANQYTLMRPHDLTVLHQDTGFIEELLELIVSCSVFGMVARFLGLPTFLGHMGAGMLMGPLGLDRVRHMVQIDSLGQLGVEIFLFVLGLELDLQHLSAGATAWVAATVALILAGAMLLLCIGIALAYQLPLSDAVIVGGCLGLSSTPVAIGACTDR